MYIFTRSYLVDNSKKIISVFHFYILLNKIFVFITNLFTLRFIFIFFFYWRTKYSHTYNIYISIETYVILALFITYCHKFFKFFFFIWVLYTDNMIMYIVLHSNFYFLVFIFSWICYNNFILLLLRFIYFDSFGWFIF